MTDTELIARVLVSNDRAAFGELVMRHQSTVRRFLRNLTRNDAALADDLAQETFVQAWRGIARFEGRASFSTWLMGIAHNHWRNARRKRRTVALGPEHVASLESVPSPSLSSDMRDDVDHALTMLADEQRTTLHLHYVQGMSHSEIAWLLKWPLGTVKTHINRGKQKLRSILTSWNAPT